MTSKPDNMTHAAFKYTHILKRNKIVDDFNIEDYGILYDINKDGMPPDMPESIFKTIYENKESTDLTLDLTDYSTQVNANSQTPLMYAALLNNRNFVEQLLIEDCCMVDNFDKMAIDYATNSDIKKILSKYELLYKPSSSNYILNNR